MVEETNDKEFKKLLKQHNKIVFDFFADWCAPCKMLAPIFEETSKNFPDVAFFKMNVDKGRKTAQKYSIMSIPTLLFFKNGKLAGTTLGVLNHGMLKEKIKEYLE